MLDSSYTALQQNEFLDATVFPTAKTENGRSARKRNLVYAAYTAIAFVFGTLAVITIANIQVTKVLTCGNTAVEAQSLGCIFEELNTNWVRPECVDEQIEAEFAAQNFKYYSQPHGIQVSDYDIDDQIENKDLPYTENQDIYVTVEWHLVHCVYSWEKMHRAVQGGRPIDSHAMNFEHTRHCGMMLLREAPRNRTSVVVNVEFEDCPVKRSVWQAIWSQ